jgi:hypothetical protein
MKDLLYNILKNIFLFFRPTSSVLFTTDRKLPKLILDRIFVFVRKNSIDLKDFLIFLGIKFKFYELLDRNVS